MEEAQQPARSVCTRISTKKVKYMSIESVLGKHEERLMQLPNVTGVGIGEKNKRGVIVVFVKKRVPKSELQPSEMIPKVLEGYETDIEIELRVGSFD